MAAQEKAIPSPSVWTRPRGGREQPALSRDQIVSEALRLLDADGIDALSMRKLGNRLGAGATSLYRHVANKDELIELAVDEIYGEVELPSPSDDRDGDGANWRTETARCAHSLRRTILRHSWIASAFGETGMSHLGPNSMRLSEAMLTTFIRAGFPPHEAGQAGSTVFSYVIGMATTEAAWLTALARTGQTEQEWVERLYPAAEQAAQDYPHLREDYAEQRGKDPARTREEDFEYGLARVLDGLESRLTR
jgi:AcrR family transcriptional regulator